MREGFVPNFHEAFTQLHLGQFPAFVKCVIRDRRDRWINPNTDHILWSFQSSLPRVDEDLGISRIAAYYFGRHDRRGVKSPTKRTGPQEGQVPPQSRKKANSKIKWPTYKIDHKKDKIGVLVSIVSSTKVPFKGMYREGVHWG